MLSALSIIFLVISGCFPKTNTNTITPYYTVSDDFANYCWFKTGSYWVFQNDSTLLSDTIKVIDVLDSKRFHNQGEAFNYQAIELYTNVNTFNITKHEITAGTYDANLDEMNSLLRIYKNDGSYHLAFLPEYPVGEEINLGDQIGTYSNIEIIDIFNLNNLTYNDVYHTRVKVTINNTAEYNYWIAKNHGLIKATSTIDDQTSSISSKSDHLIGVN